MPCQILSLGLLVPACVLIHSISLVFLCLNAKEECLRTVSTHLQSALPGLISRPPTTLPQHEKDISDCEKCNKQIGGITERHPHLARVQEETSQGSENPTESSRRCWHDERWILNSSSHRRLGFKPVMFLGFFHKSAIITCKRGLNFNFYTCKVNSGSFLERQRFMAVSWRLSPGFELLAPRAKTTKYAKRFVIFCCFFVLKTN